MPDNEPTPQSEALTVEQALHQAIAHHQAGRLQDAERIYRAILQAQPGQADANHNLGVLAVQVKQPHAGLPYFKAALEANPDYGQYWLSYIDALIQTGQPDAARQVLDMGRQRGLQGEAVTTLADRIEEASKNIPDLQEVTALATLFSEGRYAEVMRHAHTMTERFPLYGLGWKVLGAALQIQGKDALSAMQKATELLPNDPEAHHNQGIALRDLGRLDDAVSSYRRALEIKPDFAEAHSNLGSALQGLGRLDDALANCRRALEIKPDLAEAHSNLGNTLRDLGQLDDAVASYRRALDIKPDLAEVHSNLGNTLRDLGQLDDAMASCRRALKIKPDLAEAHNNLGNALKDLRQLDEAMASYRRALELKPDYAEAHSNMGNTLQDLGQIDDAVVSYRRVIKIKPDFAEAYSNLGSALQDLGQIDDAVASYRRALEIKPDFTAVYRNLGSALQKLGRLDEALQNYRLSFDAKSDWKESLRRLTTPLISDTHLVLDSPQAISPAKQCKQAGIFPEGVAHFTPSIRLDAGSERPESGAKLPEPQVKKNLRIILIYPPPWQIPVDGDTAIGMPSGPPKDRNDRDLDGDFQVITYGLLTIAAQAKRAGYDVSIYNLSTSHWRDVVTLIAETKADVYGISAFTANRRGMGAVASLIRQHHPQAHITVGGPFVTALPRDTLGYFRDIDTAVIGEGEETFMELLEHLASNRPAAGIPGTAWRNGEDIAFGPPRPRIKDLNSLASPFDYFTSSIVMTSRGCPSKCTFCGSFTTWGKLLRFHSVESCLDIFKKALARLPVPFLAIKDDTFTAHRRRTIEICDAIIANKMNFLWSCDTRVDSLDEELLYKMRLAGCQMISLGVESGSPDILKNIRKETTPEMVLEATRSAQKYGMHVRYYMIVCSRGETAETIQQSNDLIKAGRPNRYFSSALSFFPGTEDWEILRETQGLTPDIFFKNDFKELNVATNRNKELQDVMLHIACDIGTLYGFNYTVTECEAVADRLPHLHSAHVESANAYLHAGQFDKAESALNRAEELHFPIAGIIDNQRACIALARGDVNAALTILERSRECYPHYIVVKNIQNLRAWSDKPIKDRGRAPALDDSVLALDFKSQLNSKNTRPTAM